MTGARVEVATDVRNVRIPQSWNLTGGDLLRIEASLRAEIETFPSTANPRALKSWKRTLAKVERLNGTGSWTEQWPGGPLLRDRQKALLRRDRKARR